MWKALALAVCLLVAGMQAMEGPTYGVKLCGREFIRAVIFTCGGSRWRRSLGNLAEDSSEGWNADSKIPDDPFQQTSSLMALGWSRDGTQESEVLSRGARSLISEEVLEALRTSDRKGRDVVVGLSNACCKWGCSKGEISSLC
ncbi:hypothetical protein DPEC_G00307950 [Dallia pectoralis]|uniref:Uncharacterized protein n=1 Tax=Dallia pectoralis TaxID=75939 RepID=A0ACC2FEG8_DALPE|nr:hypothetical protein DPEC_G00307950 [Dallia pectoralis]